MVTSCNGLYQNENVADYYCSKYMHEFLKHNVRTHISKKKKNSKILFIKKSELSNAVSFRGEYIHGRIMKKSMITVKSG